MGWISKNEKAGSYEARYRDPSGRERSRSFRTKAEARRFLNEVETAKHRGSGSTRHIRRSCLLRGPRSTPRAGSICGRPHGPEPRA
jgi:hypothetical protein